MGKMHPVVTPYCDLLINDIKYMLDIIKKNKNKNKNNNKKKKKKKKHLTSITVHCILSKVKSQSKCAIVDLPYKILNW